MRLCPAPCSCDGGDGSPRLAGQAGSHHTIVIPTVAHRSLLCRAAGSESWHEDKGPPHALCSTVLSCPPGLVRAWFPPVLESRTGPCSASCLGPQACQLLWATLRRRHSSWISSSVTQCNRGSGSGVHPAAAPRAASAPWSGGAVLFPLTLCWCVGGGGAAGDTPLLSPLAPGTHLAMARKASSTFMPVLALVSMKGTPYSWKGSTTPSVAIPKMPPGPSESSL